MYKLITSLKIFIVFAVILGIIYPLFVMLIGQAIFPYQANGSLITHQEQIIGSLLIAQEFTLPKYFHSRFSAIDYDATNSGGSNLSVSNSKLYRQTEDHIKRIKLENNLPIDSKLPADMVLCSASGLDPHISLANAMLQLSRVAKHRTLSKEEIKKLIYDCLYRDFIGIWGQKVVNVLQLNLAIDKLEKK